MAEISKITSTQGVTYDIKDTQARNDIAAIQAAISGGVTFMGQTTTALTDGATTTSITINNATVTAVKGYLVVYNSKEFVFDGTKWIEMGDLSLIGDLGWKDSASASYQPAGTNTAPTFHGTSSAVTITAAANTNGNYQPAGSITKPTFTGLNTTMTGSFKPAGDVTLTNSNKTATVSPAASGTATYTPGGTIDAPTISVKTAGSTASVTPFGGLGSLPTFATRVTGETLTFEFDEGVLPTPGTAVTVKTGDAAYSASAPLFHGTDVRLVTDNISVPTSASFDGTSGTVSVSGKPNGEVAAPTFEGTKVQLSGTTTASGTVDAPTFTGTPATITVT